MVLQIGCPRRGPRPSKIFYYEMESDSDFTLNWSYGSTNRVPAPRALRSNKSIAGHFSIFDFKDYWC